MNPKVDFYFNRAGKWQEHLNLLRSVILDTGLEEELKWGVPCYTFEKKNIVLIHDFKEYCAILFPKGALLPDPANILIQQTKNVQAARQVRFTHAAEIAGMRSVLKAYVQKAIEVEKAGLKMKLKGTEKFEIAEEFQAKLDQVAGLKEAFKRLTPGRQRAYLLHFSSAKRSATRAARVEKYMPGILAGKGLND